LFCFGDKKNWPLHYTGCDNVVFSNKTVNGCTTFLYWKLCFRNGYFSKGD
jgi:hypothetical protein